MLQLCIKPIYRTNVIVAVYAGLLLVSLCNYTPKHEVAVWVLCCSAVVCRTFFFFYCMNVVCRTEFPFVNFLYVIHLTCVELIKVFLPRFKMAKK